MSIENAMCENVPIKESKFEKFNILKIMKANQNSEDNGRDANLDNASSIHVKRKEKKISFAAQKFAKNLIVRTSANPNVGSSNYSAVNELLSKDIVKKYRSIRKSFSVMSSNSRISRKDSIPTEEVLDEKDFDNKNTDKSYLVIYPDSIFKLIWDLIGMIFIIYQSIIVPVRLCFGVNSSSGLGYFEIMQDFYFFADILLTFNTGYYSEGFLSMTRKKIFLNYIKCWFWLDLAASFPYSMVISFDAYFNFESPDVISLDSPSINAAQLIRLLKFMRITRLIRLVRVVKVKKLLVRLEEYLVSDVFNISIQFLKLLLIILFIAHWGACFWFMLGMSELGDHGYSWVTEAGILDSDYYTQYIFSLYFYIMTMATIGYGDILPVTRNEKIYAASNMLLSCAIFAYVISSISIVIATRYDAETVYKRKMVNVSSFLNSKKISKELVIKIRRYLEYVLENKKEHKIDENEVLTLINQNLRDEINLHLFGLILKGFNLLNQNEEFCILLTYYMKEETLNPNELIFKTGDDSTRTYFITKGNVILFEEEFGIVYKTLNEENSFGEIGFFKGCGRTCSAESINFVNLTYISSDFFKECCNNYKLSQPDRFKKFKDEINLIRVDFYSKNLKKYKLICYLCNSDNHLAYNCQKLLNFDNYYKFKFRDKKHKTDYDMKEIFDATYKKIADGIEDDSISVENFFSENEEDYFKESLKENFNIEENFNLDNIQANRDHQKLEDIQENDEGISFI